MRAIACLLVCAALAGCRTRLPGAPAEAEGPTDLTASRLDLGACRRQHQLVARAMSEMYQLNPAPTDEGQQQYGSVIRVLVGVPLAPCETFGPIQLRVMPGDATDLVTIDVRVWQTNLDCGAPRTAYRVAMFSSDDGLSNPRVVVRDGAPGATRQIAFSVEPRPQGASCGVDVPINGRCQLDCQCTKSNRLARCILDRPGPPASGTCQVPCAEDADCPATTGQRCTVENEFICVAPASDRCLQDCPFGQACQRGACRPKPVTLPPSLPACHCDAECGVDWICTDRNGCILPCATRSNCAQTFNNCDETNGCTII